MSRTLEPNMHLVSLLPASILGSQRKPNDKAKPLPTTA